MLEPENASQERNGYYQVRCLSEKAQEAYRAAECMKVFEYWPAEKDIRPFETRYAVQWGPYFSTGRTSGELEGWLESIADALPDARETAGRLYDLYKDMDAGDYLDTKEKDLQEITRQLLQVREAAPALYSILERVTE